MNASLADGTATGDLVLQQAKIVPQTQHFFDFSHGQSLLGHSVSPLARGEIPIGCPAPLSAPTQKARSRNVNINPGSNPPLSSRFGLFTSPESLFTSPRNRYPHAPEYAAGEHGLGAGSILGAVSAPVLTRADQGSDGSLGHIVGRIQTGTIKIGKDVRPLVLQMFGQPAVGRISIGTRQLTIQLGFQPPRSGP